MDKVILPAFRANVPGVPIEINKPAWNLPLSIATNKGIDLDFGPLLLFEKAIISKENFDYLQDSTKKYLEPIKESVRILIEEGFIELVDFLPILKSVKEQVRIQTLSAIEDPNEWTKEILTSLEGWKKVLPSYRTILQDDYDPISMPVEFGTYVYLMKRDGKIIITEEERIRKLMGSNKKRFKLDEIDELREIVKPTVSYLLNNIGVSEILQAPFVDVDFSTELYNKIYMKSMRNLNPSVSKHVQNIEAATQLFSVAIPHLRPKSPSQLIRLLNDPRIKSFREFINQRAYENEMIDPQTLNRLMVEAIRAEKEIQNKQGKIKWIGRVISLIPYANIPVIIAEEAANLFQKKTKSQEFKWLYALIDIVK